MSEPEQIQEGPAEVMRVNAVAAALGVSKSTIWAWARSGRFPRPRRLGGRLTVWPKKEVMEFIAALPYASDDEDEADVKET